MADGGGGGAGISGINLSELVKRTAQANARFYKGWMDLSMEYVRGISGILGGAAQTMAPVEEMDPGAGALVLEGEAGAPVRGTFLVSNDLDRPASCKFVASDFKNPNGVRVPAKVVFDPPGIELGPGEQRVVSVSIFVDDALSPGVGHAGEISISGMEGFAVPVVLRRQTKVDDAVNGDDLTTPETKERKPAPAAPPASKPAAKKSVGKQGRGRAAGR
ncbi:MAG: hypothetical protein ABIP93_15070 [Gemmatimonadaceae bacterium]